MKNKNIGFKEFIKQKDGLVGYAEITKAGYDKSLIRSALKSGYLQKIDRGLYRLTNGSSLPNPDVIAAMIRIPKGIICLLSALSFHQATDEIPRHIDIAIPRGKHANKIKYPPVRYYRIAIGIWEAGLEEHIIKGRKLRVYNLARTIVDCFKFRNKIGINVARDALKTGITEKGVKPKEIMRYAKLCRVESIIKPILEAII